MDPNGDITDAFDDADDLIRSVEDGQKGPWHDETAKFTEPDLEKLAAELQGTQRHDYHERRLRELRDKARAEDRPQPEPRRPRKRNAPIPPWGDNQFENQLLDDPEPAPTTPAGSSATRFTAAEEHSFEAIPETAVQSPPSAEAEPATARPPAFVERYAPSLFAAMLVFIAATVIHGMLRGWQPHLLWRAIAAMGCTGILWQALQSGRLRAIAIGAVVYTVSFVPSADIQAPEPFFAVVLGLLVVVAGSGLIGVQRRDL